MHGTHTFAFSITLRDCIYDVVSEENGVKSRADAYVDARFITFGHSTVRKTLFIAKGCVIFRHKPETFHASHNLKRFEYNIPFWVPVLRSHHGSLKAVIVRIPFSRNLSKSFRMIIHSRLETVWIKVRIVYRPPVWNAICSTSRRNINTKLAVLLKSYLVVFHAQDILTIKNKTFTNRRKVKVWHSFLKYFSIHRSKFYEQKQSIILN